MINRFELLGNLTHAPELRYSGQGVPYCFVRMATNRYFGERKFTDFHFVTAWRNQAERAAHELTTGDRVFVEGRIETYVEEHDGVRRERTRLVATRVLQLQPMRRDEVVETPTGPEHVADVVAGMPGLSAQQPSPTASAA